MVSVWVRIDPFNCSMNTSPECIKSNIEVIMEDGMGSHLNIPCGYEIDKIEYDKKDMESF